MGSFQIVHNIEGSEEMAAKMNAFVEKCEELNTLADKCKEVLAMMDELKIMRINFIPVVTESDAPTL